MRMLPKLVTKNVTDDRERGKGVSNLGLEIVHKFTVQERMPLEEYTRGV